MYNIKQEVVITTTKKNGDVQEIKKKIHLFGFGKAPDSEQYFSDDRFIPENIGLGETIVADCMPVLRQPYMPRFVPSSLKCDDIRRMLAECFTNHITGISKGAHVKNMYPPVRFIRTSLRGKELIAKVDGDEIVVLDDSNPKKIVRSRIKLNIESENL